MSAAAPLFLWLPLLAVLAHLIEEFVWPGGFPDWYRRYRPARAASVTPRFLFIVNAILVIIALMPPALGATSRAYGYWIVVAAIGAANAFFHIRATAEKRAYSPGVITGTLLYVPLAAWGGELLLEQHLISTGTAIEAAIIAIVFHIFSAWNHTRRAAQA